METFLAQHLELEAHRGAHGHVGGILYQMINCLSSVVAYIPQPPQASLVSTSHAFTGARDVVIAASELIFQIWKVYKILWKIHFLRPHA